MSLLFDEHKVAAELTWLKRYPAFDEKPASIKEFLGPDYLNIIDGMRPGLVTALEEIFGRHARGDRIAVKQRAMFTGAIGIGKTTFASIAIPYMVHWVLCLKDPQAFYDLLPGSRIAFMQMSTSEDQAKEVLFGDISARIKHSKWFNESGFLPDPSFKNQMRFSKDIWVLPGNSSELTFEGYNILGGILDEMDSHKITAQKDYAEAGYDTISNRITSRFQDRGLLIIIGQMKKAVGFAAKKYKEYQGDPDAVVIRMTIWESLGWHKFLNPDGSRNSFWYDTKRKVITPNSIVEFMDKRDGLLEIPTVYLKDFQNNPEKALRDQAGIPPAVGDPFISLVDRIEDCRDKWRGRYDDLPSPVNESPSAPTFHKWFHANDSLRRAIHIDLAYSAEGDALGLAMGHVPEVVEIDGEVKPYIVFDCLLRWKAAPGTEIMLGDVRRMIYHIKEELGFRLKVVTFDGFESTDTMQQLRKRRYDTENVSVDKSTLPYHDLREAIYERRLEFPPYYTYLKPGDTELVEIAVQELMQLTDTGKKIDHPEGGSKDVTDAMAGVCYTLMGDRKYRRGVSSLDKARAERDEQKATGTDSRHIWSPADNVSIPVMPGGMLTAPVPPMNSITDLYPRLKN